MEIDLSEKRYLVGIDPGFNKSLGIAIYDTRENNPAEAFRLFGGGWYDGIDWLGKNVKLTQCVAVLEDPSLESSVFKALGIVAPQIKKYADYQKRKAKGEWPLPDPITWEEVASALKVSFTISQGIGNNKAAGILMKELLERHRVVTIRINPNDRHNAEKRKMDPRLLVMPTKLNARQFQSLTGCSLRCNGHARDAATLVWGKDMKWASFQLMKAVKDNAAKTRKKSQDRNKAKKKRPATKVVPKKERKFFNVVGGDYPGQRVTKDVNGKFIFVE